MLVSMRCVICHEKVRTNIDEHVGSHLSVTQNEILEYFKKLAAPYQVRLHKVICADVKKKKILFNVENAKLFVAFAERWHHIPWEDCCKWMALHEKAHIRLRDLYVPPDVNPNIVSNVEDYYIEEHMMPRKYERVHEAHVGLIVAIRKMTALPRIIALGDVGTRISYYLAFATWYASDVITSDEMGIGPYETRFVENVAKVLREVDSPRDLSTSMSVINTLYHDFSGLLMEGSSRNSN